MEIASTEKIWEAMLGPTYNILRDRKLATNAQACIDSAVLDAWGKSLNQPLFKLWGGYKTELPVVAIAGYYEEGTKLADFGTEMENMRADGLGGCKLKVGGRRPDEEDRKSVVSGKSVSGSVDLGGRRIIKKKKREK